MTDEELVKSLRIGGSNTAADRIEALVAEVAGLRVERGRVPESWDECADWLDAGGVVLFDNQGHWEPTGNTVAEFRNRAYMDTWDTFSLYRLMPPPNLVAAPPGMDGGGFLGAGADVPEGWEWRPSTGWAFQATDRCHWTQTLVQCRPPVKPAVRATVQVPLTKLVGRVIEGETDPIVAVLSGAPGKIVCATADETYRPFPEGTLDLDTGMVSVYAEDGES